MYYLDLVKLLKAYKGSIKNVEVYGRISARLPRPSNIDPSIKEENGGMWVRVDVLAVNLSYIESYLKVNGYTESNSTYMVNGSLVAFINPVGKEFPQWYAIRGTLAQSKTYDNLLSLIGWSKSGNDWSIKAINVDDIKIDYWDRKSPLFVWAEKSYSSNCVVLPSEVQNMIKFTHKPPEVIPVSVDTGKSLDSMLEENTNGVAYPDITKSKTKIMHESRDMVKSYSDDAIKLQSLLDDSKMSRDDFVKGMKSSYPYSDKPNKYIQYMLDGLLRNLSRKPHPDAQTGRMLLKKYLSDFGKHATVKYVGMTCADYMISIFDEIRDMILGKRDYINADGVALDLYKLAFYDVEKFYCLMISHILNLNLDSMIGIYENCARSCISFSRIVNENPYALQLLGDLSFNNVEHIALCFGRNNDKNIKLYKNIALIHSKINDTDNGSTAFERKTIERSNIGVKISKSKYESMCQTGSILTGKMTENIRHYIRRFDGGINYELGNWHLQGYCYTNRISGVDVSNAVNDYISSGLGIEYGNFITAYNMLSNELNIYSFFHQLGESDVDYSDSEIDKYIDEYEDVVGFKLEKEQRQAVHLLKRRGGVIAGSAGSGKTTVSNCMVYVMNKLDPSIEIKFAAPTGKAAKRMQEVVKKEVKTLNSMFKVFDVGSNLFNPNEEEDSSDDVFFFDEGAMINLDLLNAVVNKIDVNEARIYLFGDYHQLPPIGKGLPFKNLLRFMPCVFLTVSKRAAEGSDITRNSDYINNNSETNNWKILVTGRDFMIAPCVDAKIPELTKGICSHYLGKNTVETDKRLLRELGIPSFPEVNGLTPDDIQVVSPIGKPTYEWGSAQMNNVLQPLFNPNRGYKNTIVYQTNKASYTKFILGDRVIHTDKNMYSMQWYSGYTADGEFQKTYGFGICNGEVGKIVGIFKNDDVRILDEEGSEPADFKYPESLRDDTTFTDSNGYFVVVQYYDYISAKNFYILYRCNETEFDCSFGKSLNGEDLSRLALFYAGTTHKLQGSQSKLIISVLGNVKFGGFITRNMMYTVYTRAEKLVFAIGSVANNQESMLSKARREVAEIGVVTIGELLTKQEQEN